MNTTASNLANAGTKSSTIEGAYHGKRVVFKALMDEQDTHQGAPFVGGVKVDQIGDIKSLLKEFMIHLILKQMKRVLFTPQIFQK